MARTLDEILTTEMPDVVTQAREKAEQMRLEVHMSHLREMLTKAGTELHDLRSSSITTGRNTDGS